MSKLRNFIFAVPVIWAANVAISILLISGMNLSLTLPIERKILTEGIRNDVVTTKNTS